MKRNWRWSEADDQKLAAALAEGKSMRAIAAALRRTAGAVETRPYILRTKANSTTTVAKFEDRSENDN